MFYLSSSLALQRPSLGRNGLLLRSSLFVLRSAFDFPLPPATLQSRQTPLFLATGCVACSFPPSMGVSRELAIDEVDVLVVEEQVCCEVRREVVCSFPLLAGLPRRGLRSGSGGSANPRGHFEKWAAEIKTQAPLGKV